MLAPATYRTGTPRNQHPAVARWHVHLRDLATAIHEISGLQYLFKIRLEIDLARKVGVELHCLGLVSVHPETTLCHSEPFDKFRTGSVKNLCGPTNYEILRRPASAGLLRMTSKNTVSGWTLVKRVGGMVTIH